MSYRAINYRDGVLWAVARKLGLEPEKHLDDGLALALAGWANSWVRRYWDAADWPEWANIAMRAPNASHYVPFTGDEVKGSRAGPIKVGKVLRVYLNNPDLTPHPIDTPFRLTEKGIHVGFEHGSFVWIKSLPPAPEFTAEKWSADRTYAKNELTYSPKSGECYVSLLNNNRGHDPFPPTGRDNLVPEITQPFAVAQPAIAGASEKWSSRVDAPDWYNLAGTEYTILLTDKDGMSFKFIYTTPGAGGTVATLLTGLAAAVTGLPPNLTGIIVTTDTPTATIALELTTAPFSLMLTAKRASDGATTTFPLTHISSYRAVVAAVATTPTKIQFQLNTANEGLPTEYIVTLTDAAGVEHIVIYVAPADQSLTDTVAGLQAAINTAATTDAFWGSVVVNPLAIGKGFEIAAPRVIDIQATAGPTVQIYWELRPFPLALVDDVVNGTYADALKEQGQTDKGAMEEQGAIAGATATAGKIAHQTQDLLTDQVER